MEPLESTTCSFIIRIWQERVGVGERDVAWRGHITHVPSGARRSLDDFEDIITFIGPYLASIGIPTAPVGQVRRWLAHRVRWLAHGW